MGLFGRVRDEVVEVENVILEALEDEGVQLQVTAILLLVTTMVLVRSFTSSKVGASRGVHTLDLSCLNDCANFKEVFLGYLQAAVLEPVLAIGGIEEAKDISLIINLLTLASICWWIWLITDAFDFCDVMQCFKYSNEFREEIQKDPTSYEWLQLSDVTEDAEKERKTLRGSLARDVGLWFMIASIAAAWLPGPVTHRDVLHAYVVVFLWIILHEFCRRAMTWTESYVTTFFFPSTALMPLEYGLPLMDVADTVEDIEFLVHYREFVLKRTGVEMIIKS